MRAFQRWYVWSKQKNRKRAMAGEVIFLGGFFPQNKNAISPGSRIFLSEIKWSGREKFGKNYGQTFSEKGRAVVEIRACEKGGFFDLARKNYFEGF